MNQAEVHKLITSLRFKVSPKAYNFASPRNPPSVIASNNGNRYRLELLRTQVTSLIVNERLELTKHSGVTVREYTERLIQEAISHGDTHKPTMELADWWLEDKAAIHKLFKVIVPRMKEQPFAFTRQFNAPSQASANKEGQDRTMRQWRDKVIVELVGHPFPPLHYSNTEPNRKMIHNVLLAEARREMRLQKQSEQRETSLNQVRLEDEVD